MIKGMTGFGNAQLSLGKLKIAVEVKSLNHRYFDITYYLPTGFGALENKIRQIVQKQIERGRISVSLKVVQKSTQTISLNREVLKQHLKYAQILQKEFGLKNDLALSDVIRLPGVLEMRETYAEAEEIWPYIEKGLNKSLNGLMNMRFREGQTLSRDIVLQLNHMLAQIKTINTRARVILKEKKTQLTPEEFNSFQKSSDINEELTRLSHYIHELKLLLKSHVSGGKKVDFVAQEMQRETNTIGSKLQDKIVSNAVIALKSKIEKIREQSQNIE